MTPTESLVYTIKNANSIERVADDLKLKFNKAWLYPAKGIAKNGDGSGVTPGKRIPNGGTISVGEHTEGADCTPDDLLTGDPPIKFELPQGDWKYLKDVIIQGAAGDGVYIKYWPA